MVRLRFGRNTACKPWPVFAWMYHDPMENQRWCGVKWLGWGLIVHWPLK